MIMNEIVIISDVESTRFLLLQVFSIGILLAQLTLTAVALIYVRRQSLSVRDQLFWDVFILLVPVIGALIAFRYLRSQKSHS